MYRLDRISWNLAGGHGSRARTIMVGLLVVITMACETEDSPSHAPYQSGEELPGGTTTNTFLFGSNAFMAPVTNITIAHEADFFVGNSFFNQNWISAPASTQNRDGLGPLWNAMSCSACHFRDGRGRPPIDDTENFVGLLLRLSIDGRAENGAPVPDPNYGGQLQPFANLGIPAEGQPSVTYTVVAGTYGDGKPYELLKPTYAVSDLAYGPMDPTIRMSPRVAPAMIGLGLLETIPETRLEELEDPDDADNNGISGRRNWVWDVQQQALAVGRFGWKAEQPTVLQQTAGAFVNDMGITSGLFPVEICTPGEQECSSAQNGGQPEIEESLLSAVATYSRLLAVPKRSRYKDTLVLTGKRIFMDTGCADCHVPSHQTADNAELPEVRGQRIWPYTDLLLHDMGEELSDNRPSFGAQGNEWRTAPLWGLRFYDTVNGHDRLLHDGRARGTAEAILWHGGEAETSREQFRNLDVSDREALITFVESL